jgi:hypothetical protein
MSLHGGISGSSATRNSDLDKQAGDSQEAARHAETQKQGTPTGTEAVTPGEASASASGPGSILSAESSPEAAAGSPLRDALGQHGDATSAAEIAKTQRASEVDHTAAAAAAQAAAGAAVGAAAGAVAGAAAGAPSTGAAAGAAVGAATPGVFSAAKQAAYDFLGFEPGAVGGNGSATTQGEQVSAQQPACCTCMQLSPAWCGQHHLCKLLLASITTHCEICTMHPPACDCCTSNGWHSIILHMQTHSNGIARAHQHPPLSLLLCQDVEAQQGHKHHELIKSAWEQGKLGFGFSVGEHLGRVVGICTRHMCAGHVQLVACHAPAALQPLAWGSS